MGTCNSKHNSIDMKRKRNNICTPAYFRRIGMRLDCKHNNGNWYQAEIKFYLNCKQTLILIHYIMEQ